MLNWVMDIYLISKYIMNTIVNFLHCDIARIKTLPEQITLHDQNLNYDSDMKCCFLRDL